MLQIGSIIKVKDNSGVQSVKCFHPGIKLGDVIRCSVVKINSNAQSSKYSSNKREKGAITSFKRGDVVTVLVINTAKTAKTSNNDQDKEGGIRTKYGENIGILMKAGNKESDPRVPFGTRISGAVPRSLRNKGWGNIVAMAEYQV